jgi:hypothetical protein
MSYDSMRDGAELLLRGLIGEDLDTSVKEMGKQQQAEMSTRQQLPITGTINSEESKAHFETLGFVFGNELDNLFVEATFPEGWKIKQTEHYMRSDLLDEKDRVRGVVFFKPDFWDRKAHITLRCRYKAGCEKDYDWLDEHEKEYENSGDAYTDLPCSAVVRDYDETILHQFGPVTARQLNVNWRVGLGGSGLDDDLTLLARSWVSLNFPDWKNPTAYWDENVNK